MEIRNKIEDLIANDDCLPDTLKAAASSKKSWRQEIGNELGNNRPNELISITNVLSDTKTSWKAKETFSLSVLKGENNLSLPRTNSFLSLSSPVHRDAKDAFRDRSDDEVQRAINLVTAMGSQQRFQSRKHAFFELQSKKLNIDALSMSRDRPSTSMQFNKSMNPSTAEGGSRVPIKTKQLFFWGKQCIEAEDNLIFPKPNTDYNLEGRGVMEQRNKAAAAFKLEAIQKQKMEMNELKREAERISNFEKESFDKRLRIKKSAREFRKMLLKKLKDKNDPYLSDFARCITEEAVTEFLEKYKGYSMSLHAIMSLLGSPIGDIKDNPINSADEMLVGAFKGDLSMSFAAYHRDRSPPKVIKIDDPLQQWLAKLDDGDGDGDGDAITANRSGSNLSPVIVVRKFGSGFQFQPGKTNNSSVLTKKSNSRDKRMMSSSSSSGELSRAEGADILAQLSGHNLLGSHADHSSNSFLVLNDEDDIAIHAVKSQLIIEHTLPSIQPYRILTDDQISRLGGNKHEFEKIMKEMLPGSPSRKGNFGIKKSSVQKVSIVVPDKVFLTAGSGDRDPINDSRPTTAQNDEILMNNVMNALNEVNANDSKFAMPKLSKEKPRYPGPITDDESPRNVTIGGLIADDDSTNVSFEQYVEVTDRPLTRVVSHQGSRAPVSLSTKEILISASDFSLEIAPSPYQSLPGQIPQSTIVRCSGIPSGAGLSLWGPKRRNRSGRWVPGNPKKDVPFVSAS